MLIPPLVPHCNTSVSGFTNIHINMLEPAISLQHPALIRDDGLHFLLDSFSAAYYYFSDNSAGHSLLLACYGDLIVRQILTRQEASPHSAVTESILAMIIRRYPDENFELDRYLHSLAFNYDYLRKLFKSEVGETPNRFLIRTRLQAAAQHLSFANGHGISISEVARECGFRDALYFSRMFRKEFGVSPSQYQSSMFGETGHGAKSEPGDKPGAVPEADV